MFHVGGTGWLRLVDEAGNEVPNGSVGELIVQHDRPSIITDGYLNMPEATEAAWRDGWFHTGDLFRQDAAGDYYFVDRNKDALRRRGENISSLEVEAVIATHPGVLESAIIGVLYEPHLPVHRARRQESDFHSPGLAVLDWSVLSEGPDAALPPVPSPESDMVYIYTSGTTGASKAVRCSYLHHEAYGRRLPLGPSRPKPTPAAAFPGCSASLRPVGVFVRLSGPVGRLGAAHPRLRGEAVCLFWRREGAAMPRRSKRSAKSDASAKSVTRERTNLYDEVTAKIIAELEAGRFPWVQPWGRVEGTGPGLPRNAITARPYSGINILILWSAVLEQGWPSQSWLTFRQALDAGGCVRKGERGVTVVYADRFTPKAERERAARDGDDAKAIPFLKRFTVFNVAQCEGLRAGLASDPAPLPEREIVPVAEEVIAASGVDFRIGGDRAFYAPVPDFVQVPPQPAFFEQINYYRTCLHELTHATGHPKRLGRNLLNSFGSKDYAREELVALSGQSAPHITLQ